MNPRSTIYRSLTVLFLVASLEATPQWSQASLSTPRGGIAACSSGSTALFAGGKISLGWGVDQVDIYDAQTDSWSSAQLSVPRHMLTAAAVGSEILIAGGASNSNDHSDVVDIYDTTTGQWRTANLSMARSGIGAGSVAGTVFFAGGVNLQGTTDRIDIYSAATNTWSTATLSEARFGIQVATIGARIFFVGGNPYPAGWSDVIDVYDSSNGSWSTMQFPVAEPLETSATTGNLALFCTTGGDVWIYDDTSGSWSMTALSHPRHAIAATAVGDQVLFAGGHWHSVDFDTVDIYDTSTGAWQVAALSTSRDSIGATTLAGRAFFAGGYDGWPTVANVVDIYDPGPGHWFCAGDGLGTPCPCANDGGAGRGCVNSTGDSALLADFGSASVSAGDLGFTLTDAIPGQTALLFAAQDAVNGGLGIAFGDGLRCAGGPAVRLDLQLVDGDGTVVWDPAPYGGWNPGNVRRFQVYYRDPAGPCGSTFNLSNGVEIQFVP